MNPFNSFTRTILLPSVACIMFTIAGCAKGPDSPEVKLERAKILMAQGQTANAIPLLDGVIQALPKNSEAYFQRGMAYETLDLPEKALDDYTACFKLDDMRTDALNNKAVQLATLKRHDEAIAAFTELVDLDREDFLGFRNRGLCRFDLQDNTGALEDYNAAIRLNPDDASSWFQRGNVYLAMNSLDAAGSDYSKALELDPEFAKALMNRGVVRYRKGEMTLAADDLRQAQELDGNIVIPAIDFFNNTPPSAAATEVMAGSAWESCRSFIQKDLADRGFTELIFVQQFPDLQCAELTGKFEGRTGVILVTCQQQGQSTVTLPYMDRAALAGNERPSCSLLVLRMPENNGHSPEVTRFEQQWDPSSQTGAAVIMNYEL